MGMEPRFASLRRSINDTPDGDGLPLVGSVSQVTPVEWNRQCSALMLFFDGPLVAYHLLNG